MEAKLINNSQVKKALKVKGPLGSVVAGAAMAVAGVNKINDIYSHISEFEGIELAM